MMLQDVDTTDRAVAQALNLIEDDLKPHLSAALNEINVVLAGNPAETKVLHDHAATLHRLLQHIDENRTRRARRAGTF
jgi:hypothetical protein